MAPMPERPDDSLGDLLRAARERRGLTVQDVARITRIPRRHLDAIERGQLDELPGGMYRRAEVRTYAETVGLDTALALDRLERTLGPAADPVPVPAAVMSPAPRRVYAAVVAAGLIAAAGVTVWWWRQSVTANPSEAPPAAAIALPIEAAPAQDVDEVAKGTDAPERTAVPDRTVEPTSSLPDAAGDVVPAPGVAGATDVTAAIADDRALTVTSSPPGARVLVDGIGYGQTPITIRHLQPGQRRVRLVLDGHVGTEQLVRLGRSQATLDVTLDRSP